MSHRKLIVNLDHVASLRQDRRGREPDPTQAATLAQLGGADGVQPCLDRLGGQTWEKTKRGVKKSVRRLARELIAVHAARELAPGHAFAGRDRMLEAYRHAVENGYRFYPYGDACLLAPAAP